LEIDEFIKQERENSAGYHLITAQMWRRIGEPGLLHNPLVYASFEYRLSIERIAFELYALLKNIDNIKDEELEKFDSITNVIKFIIELMENKKNLYKALLFNSLFFHIMIDLPGSISIPDVTKLKNLWLDMSNYCHMKIKPSQTWYSTDWVKNGYESLNKVEDYLWSITVQQNFGWINPITMHKEAQELRLQFINDELDESATKTRLNLMKPIFEIRGKNY